MPDVPDVHVFEERPDVFLASLRFSGIEPLAGQYALEWQAVSDRTYAVWFKTNLNDTAWSPVQGGISGTEPACTCTADVDNVTGFFRVEVRP